MFIMNHSGNPSDLIFYVFLLGVLCNWVLSVHQLWTIIVTHHPSNNPNKPSVQPSLNTPSKPNKPTGSLTHHHTTHNLHSPIPHNSANVSGALVNSHSSSYSSTNPNNSNNSSSINGGSGNAGTGNSNNPNILNNLKSPGRERERGTNPGTPNRDRDRDKKTPVKTPVKSLGYNKISGTNEPIIIR